MDSIASGPILSVNNSSRIGIDENFPAIETMSLLRIKRSIDPISVDLALFRTFHENMPVMERPVRVRMQIDRLKRFRIIVSPE